MLLDVPVHFLPLPLLRALLIVLLLFRRCAIGRTAAGQHCRTPHTQHKLETPLRSTLSHCHRAATPPRSPLPGSPPNPAPFPLRSTALSVSTDVLQEAPSHRPPGGRPGSRHPPVTTPAHVGRGRRGARGGGGGRGAGGADAGKARAAQGGRGGAQSGPSPLSAPPGTCWQPGAESTPPPPGRYLCIYLCYLIIVSSFGICQGVSWQHLNQPCVAG